MTMTMIFLICISWTVAELFYGEFVNEYFPLSQTDILLLLWFVV